MAQSKLMVFPILTLEQFEEFVYLHMPGQWSSAKALLHVLFNYILKLLYLGCQWKSCPSKRTKMGNRRSTTKNLSCFWACLKLMDALKPFSRGLCCYCTKRVPRHQCHPVMGTTTAARAAIILIQRAQALQRRQSCGVLRSPLQCVAFYCSWQSR